MITSFDPSRITPEPKRSNPVPFNLADFADAEWYRASADMLRQGMSLLNQYYYDWMRGTYDPGKVIAPAQLELMVKIIECVGGVYGFLPMRPYIPEPMRHALFRAIQHYMASMPSIYRVETYSGFTRTVKDHGELNRRLNSPGFPRILYEIPGNPAHLSKDAHGEICWIGYGGVVHNNRKSLARLLLGDCDVGFYDGNFLGNPFCLDVIPTTFPDLALYQGIRQLALYIGMPSHELEQLIEWELQPLSPKEKTALADMVTLFVNKETDKPYYEKHSSQVYNHCAAMIGNRVPRGAFVPGKATNQIDWQMEELIFFISLCLRDTPHWLAESPVKIPSGKYVETLRVERTQQDLINEMAIELSSLPPYTAYAKIIDEQSGTQRVLKHKIHTYPLPQPVRGMEIEQRLIENSHALSLERERIEAEIRQRQERWINIYRPRTPEPPPASEPPPDVPPTRF